MAVHLHNYLESNQLNEPLQSAYNRFHSCDTALTRVDNDILLGIDNSPHCVILLLLDRSSAFDTVDDDIMLKRLDSRCSICGTAQPVDWFQSHITNRTQFTLIYGQKIIISRVQMWRASRLSPLTHPVPTSYSITG